MLQEEPLQLGLNHRECFSVPRSTQTRKPQPRRIRRAFKIFVDRLSPHHTPATLGPPLTLDLRRDSRRSADFDHASALVLRFATTLSPRGKISRTWRSAFAISVHVRQFVTNASMTRLDGHWAQLGQHSLVQRSPISFKIKRPHASDWMAPAHQCLTSMESLALAMPQERLA